MKLEPGTKVGPYQILGELGRGGMATVYRAYQPALEREVALKVLPEFLVEQPGFKARFHREAVAVARLQHPNILSVFDHGEQDGVTYIVSEYVEGGTLASRMGAPIQLDYCVRILRPIADALDYAHSEGVIHRDVKPSNILLDRRGVPILSDFGLARVAEMEETERLTQAGAMVGTPTYMAPEQCSGLEAGAPADLYAVAVIAFEMITGRVPFSGPTPLAVIAAHQVTPPPSPRRFNPSLPPAIEAPLLAGLAKDPSRRPDTVTDFIDGLAASIAATPSQYPLTPPPSTELPPTPTAVNIPTPQPSYPPPPPPASQPIPSAYTPQAPVAQASAPPYAPPASPSPPGPSAPAPAAPGPAAPAPAAQGYAMPQAAPAPMYGGQAPQTWARSQAPPREGAPGWLVAVLWVAIALSVVALLWAVAAPLIGTSLSDSDRTAWLVIGVLAALAMTASLAALLGLGARDRWGPALGWMSVAALAVTVVGVPLAAAIGWGLAQAPKGQLVASQLRPGGGMRIGSSAAIGVLMLMVLSGTTAWGWTHTTPGPTPPASTTPSPLVACTILQPGSAIDSTTVGIDCGFKLGAPVVQLDCAAVTQLPSTVKSYSHDDDAGTATGKAAVTTANNVCHMASPTFHVDARIEVAGNVDPGDTLTVADFVPPTTGSVSFGFLNQCDDTGCVDVFLFLPDSDMYAYEDSATLLQQHVPTRTGTNRLMVASQGRQFRIWLNGVLVGTETYQRTHNAGTYAVYMESSEKTLPAQADLLKYSVFRLAA